MVLEYRDDAAKKSDATTFKYMQGHDEGIIIFSIRVNRNDIVERDSS